jgi:hypothetical protein
MTTVGRYATVEAAQLANGRGVGSEVTRSKPLCVKGGLLGALKQARGGGRSVVVGPGVTDPKCRCQGASRPRWIQSRP